MSGLTPFFITGYSGGMQNNKKPFLLPDKAWQILENSYCWREKEKKREGRKLLGRLQRVLTSQSLGTSPAGTPATMTIADVFVTLSIPEANAEITPGSLVITVAAPDAATFTDNGNGTFTVTGVGVASGSFVNYESGKIVLKFSTAAGGAAVTANINYFPNLPVMGIPKERFLH